MPEDEKESRENLMNSDHKSTNEVFRENYDWMRREGEWVDYKKGEE